MIQSLRKKLMDGKLPDSGEFPLVEGDRVTFVYCGEAERVDLRHWIYGLPASLPMTRIEETDLWCHEMEFPSGSRIEYKFGVTVRGHEKWILDPLNQDVAHDPFGGNSVVKTSGYDVPKWTRLDPNVPAGTTEKIAIPSDAFGDTREITVCLPAHYLDYRRHRLLIVHDGDDYVKYSRLRAVLDNLIHALEIPPLIVALPIRGKGWSNTLTMPVTPNTSFRR